MTPVSSVRLRVALAIALAPLAMSAAAKEMTVAYADSLKPLLTLDQARFDRLQGVLRLTETDSDRDRACPGAAITLLAGGERRVLAIAADGRVDVPVDRALAAAGAELLLKKPDDAPPCSLSANVVARAEPRREFAYRELKELVAQMQAFVGDIAGGLALFAPDVEGLVFTFAGPAELTIHAAAGPTVLRGADGRIELKMSDELASENPRVSWSQPVLEIQPLTD